MKKKKPTKPGKKADIIDLSKSIRKAIKHKVITAVAKLTPAPKDVIVIYWKRPAEGTLPQEDLNMLMSLAQNLQKQKDVNVFIVPDEATIEVVKSQLVQQLQAQADAKAKKNAALRLITPEDGPPPPGCKQSKGGIWLT